MKTKKLWRCFLDVLYFTIQFKNNLKKQQTKQYKGNI